MNSQRLTGMEASDPRAQNNFAMKIIRYNEWLIIHPDIRSTVYELCRDNFTKVRQISKEEARELIKENDLKMVHFNKHGAIWS